MDGELLIKIVQRIKTVAGIEAFLVLPVAALHLAVVAGRVGTDELVVYTELCSGSLKQGGQVMFAVGETIGELKSVVCLDTLHPDAPAGIPLEQPLQKVSRRVGALLGIGGQEAQASEFIYGSVLEQAQLRVCNTPAGYDFHIHLDPLAWIGHLLVGLGLIRLVFSQLQETSPASASPGTGSPDGVYNPAAAADATVPLCRGWDFGGADPG